MLVRFFVLHAQTGEKATIQSPLLLVVSGGDTLKGLTSKPAQKFGKNLG